MVCVSFYVICIVELLVSTVICRFQGLSYSHVPECIEFSFILFIRHNIHFYFEYVLIVTFWIFIHHEIWILLNIFLYGTIELFILWHVWRYSGVLWVNSCPPLPTPHQAQSCMSGHCYTIGCVIKSTHGAYVVVVQLLTFFKLHFIMEWLL